MPWLEFTDVFDWSPPALKNRVTIRYEAGKRYLVTREAAAAAVAAHKAIEGTTARRPARGKADGPNSA